MIFLWFAVLAIIVLLIGLAYWSTYPPTYKYFKNMAGPPKKLVVGNILDIPQDTVGLTQTVLDWYKIYESPMAVKLGPFYAIHFHKAAHMEKIMKHSVNIQKSRDYRLLEPWLGDGLLFSSGKKWHERRKLLTPTFHFQILKDFVPVFNRQALTMMEILSNLHQIDTGEPINICSYITMCTLDIICETAMGKTVNAQKHSDSDYVKAIYTIGEIASYRSFRPWLWISPIFYMTQMGKQFQSCVNRMHNFTYSVIAERENEVKSSTDQSKKKRQAFLDLLLEMKRNGQITLEGVREETDTFMFEGHDTTSTGLMWAMYLIGFYPDVQQKLVEEIEEIFGTDKTTDIPHDKLGSLPYMEQVLKESQRLLPSVPIVAREIIEPLELDNYTIPVGTTVNISIIGLHRNPEYFPDPYKFDPERFSPDNIEDRHPFAFTPFSAGLRNCIGQKFALLEEKVVLVHMLRHFKLESTQKFEDLKPSIELVLRPTQGIWLKLSPRSY